MCEEIMNCYRATQKKYYRLSAAVRIPHFAGNNFPGEYRNSNDYLKTYTKTVNHGTGDQRQEVYC